jgi:hypothetical protein
MICSRTGADFRGGQTTEDVQMKIRNAKTHMRCQALPREDLANEPGVCILDEEDDMPGSAYLVMHEGRYMPALQEFLQEVSPPTIH